ncbi:MAG: uroporphyrinogen decarboxylase family protein, partial [Kiritimatiellia bacterium]|nr:uroporphyrinogen decarboxylase family protein [Kiritimatiellia bacterium]
MRQPDFDQLRRVLNRERPERPTLFEFFLNGPLYEELAGEPLPEPDRAADRNRVLIRAFQQAGYDYATIHPPAAFAFAVGAVERKESLSLNAYHSITDRESLLRFPWPNPDTCDYSLYDRLEKDLPRGMKAIVCGPGGVLENVIRLVGYDPLCLMTLEDPNLLMEIFGRVGRLLVRHYEIAASFPAVGALMSNDDWGFNSQTLLSPDDFERYLFPWHRKIVRACHRAGKPVILHSCGNLEKVMGAITDDIGYDGKHSFEDKILPVEEAYERHHSKIAILGGLDLDFVCRKTPAEITARARAMLVRSADRGAYALGTGNSVPAYTPTLNYFAM